MTRLTDMTFRQPTVISALAAAAVVLVAASVNAQTTRTGGLFGATREGDADRTHVSGLFTLGEMVETELPEEFRFGLPGNRRPTGGLSTLLMGSGDFAHNLGRAQIAAAGETAFRYYDRLGLVDDVGHSAGVGVNVRLPRRASIRLNQTAAYSPSFLYGLFPSSVTPALGDATPVAPEYGVLEAGSYRYQTEAEFAIGSTSGTRVSVLGTYDRTDLRNRPGSFLGLESQSGRVRASRGIRRNLGVTAEYQYRNGRFGVVQFGTTDEHRIAIGIDYSRPLSGGRRLNVRGNVAPSMMDIPRSSSPRLLAGRLYRMQGDGTVEYLFKRTWRVSSALRRSAEYLALLGEPVLSDAGTVTLAGLLTRRLDLQASAAYADGASVITMDRQLESYTGTVMLRFAVKRSIAIFGEYLYYHYDLRHYQASIAGLPTMLDQQGISVGVTLWGSTSR